MEIKQVYMPTGYVAMDTKVLFVIYHEQDESNSAITDRNRKTGRKKDRERQTERDRQIDRQTEGEEKTERQAKRE